MNKPSQVFSVSKELKATVTLSQAGSPVGQIIVSAVPPAIELVG